MVPDKSNASSFFMFPTSFINLGVQNCKNFGDSAHPSLSIFYSWSQRGTIPFVVLFLTKAAGPLKIL